MRINVNTKFKGLSESGAEFRVETHCFTCKQDTEHMASSDSHERTVHIQCIPCHGDKYWKSGNTTSHGVSQEGLYTGYHITSLDSPDTSELARGHKPLGKI